MVKKKSSKIEGFTNVRLSDEVKSKLDDLGKKNDSYDDIIRKMLNMPKKK